MIWKFLVGKRRETDVRVESFNVCRKSGDGGNVLCYERERKGFSCFVMEAELNREYIHR